MLMQALRYNAGRIRVKDCPFGAADGVASNFQLVDRHGHAVTKDVRIASIRQTDWQGRVELSYQPRTNIVYFSQDLSSAYWATGAAGITIDSTSQTIDGTTIPYWGVSTDGTNSYVIQYIRESFAAGDTVTLVCAWRAGTLTSCRPCILSYAEPSTWGDNSLSTARILSGPGALTQNIGANWHLHGLSQTEDTVVAVTRQLVNANASNQSRIYAYPGPPGNSLVGDVLTTAYGVFKNNSDHIEYIPTTNTARTVIDYTHDGAGGIATGQVPGAAASLDWTGTARRAA